MDSGTRNRGVRGAVRLAGAALAAFVALGLTPGVAVAAPPTDAQVAAAEAAIRRSGLAPCDVAHGNAHATSTPAGDMAEARWIANQLGEQTVVTVTKSMTGHLLGASGAIEAIATVLSVANDVVPPTINLDDPEDGLAVDVPTKARDMVVTAALNDSFGFGGHNTSLLFHKL